MERVKVKLTARGKLAAETLKREKQEREEQAKANDTEYTEMPWYSNYLDSVYKERVEKTLAVMQD
jgi:hypothetical protein